MISLVSCPVQPYNLVFWVNWLREIGLSLLIETVISSLCFSMIILLMVKKFIPWYCVIISTINIFILYQQKLGQDLLSHGSLNRVFHFLFIIGNVVTYWTVKLAIWTWRKSKTAIFIIVSSGFLVLVLFYFVRVKDSWSGWEYGLHNAKLENGDGLCFVPVPSYWELKIREGMLDFNRFANKWSDSSMKFYKNNVFENSQTSKADIKRVGYPRTEHMPNDAKLKSKSFIRFVKQNLIDMDDPSVSQTIKDNVEFVVDITESHTDKLTIDVKRNQTRCNELKEIRQKVLEEDKLNTKLFKNLL